MRRVSAIFKDKKGATAIEYGLILALVFLAMIVGVTTFGQTTSNMWNHVSNSMARNT
jgi:pilus assembly protein Flp/PilA